ncbi:hypothetical protein NFI96_008433 [Prochilodus magdalenae]|nr:hypothetical protein NFI96_008433 [Prochilodus magdalenae]
MPREISGVILTPVYIPPQADTDLALGELYKAVNRQETTRPEAACIVVGDFNTANFRKVAPKFVQHVLCSTRGSRTLDHCYTPFRDEYKARPRPPFGKSDHSSILLLPTYRQKLKQDIMYGLGGNSWFSLLDQGKAYHQGFMTKVSRPMTAFVTPWGLYEWIRIPGFGLKNAPAAFQRCMKECLEGLRDDICIPYLDDTIVFRKSFLDHVNDVRTVLQWLGQNGKSIAARKIAPQSTIYRIIKNFKERGSIVAKKAPGRPRKTSKRQDHLLKVFQLRDRATSSAELAQEWQQAGVSASARTVRRRLLEQGLVSRRAAKKPLLSRKNIRDRLIFCKRYREWTAEDWGKVIFSDESPFRLFGTSGKQLVRRRRAKGIGSLTVLPKNTAMNKEWYQNVLREQLLPTVQEQFEFLALKWAVCERFRDYLIGSSCTVYTDNNPLTYVLSTAKLNATGHRLLSYAE